MQFGFTSTSFRQIKSIERVTEIAVDTGSECIEWGGDIHIKDINAAKEAKLLCDNKNIIISSYGSYYRVGSKDSEEWQRICEIASAMNANSIRVWLGKKDSEKTDDNTYKAIVDDAQAICDTAQKFNLKVCCECHDNTYNNNTDAFLKIYKDVGFNNFRTYFQSRYKRLQYDLDRIERTMPYTENIHISYSEQAREQFPLLKPDYIDKLLSKIISCGFDGNLLVEYTYLFSRAGIPSAMKKDLTKLRTKVGELK